MAVYCLLALLAGVLVSAWFGFGQFALASLVTVCAGTALSVWHGMAPGTAVVWAVIYFALAQIGYAIGLVAVAVMKANRHHGANSGAQDSGPASPLRHHKPL